MKQKHIFIAELLKGRDYVAAGELLHKDLVCMDSVVLDFTGVEGVVVRVKRSRRVVVELPGMFAVATTFVHPRDLELL